MDLVLKRNKDMPSATLGQLFEKINGKLCYLCDTMEPPPSTRLKRIRPGKYLVEMRDSPRHGHRMPHVIVSNTYSVLLCSGHTPDETAGNILLGQASLSCKLHNSYSCAATVRDLVIVGLYEDGVVKLEIREPTAPLQLPPTGGGSARTVVTL